MKIDFETIRLERGAHHSSAQGGCLLEWSSYLAGEAWSDRPACVSPVIAAFGRAWNDALDDERRQILKPYAQKVIGTPAAAKARETANRLRDTAPLYRSNAVFSLFKQ